MSIIIIIILTSIATLFHAFCFAIMSLYTTEFTCHKHGKVRTASQSFSLSMLASSGFCMFMHFVATWAREISAILIGWTQCHHAGVEPESTRA